MVKIFKCYLIPKKSYGTLSKGAIFLANPVFQTPVFSVLLNLNMVKEEDFGVTKCSAIRFNMKIMEFAKGALVKRKTKVAEFSF